MQSFKDSASFPMEGRGTYADLAFKEKRVWLRLGHLRELRDRALAQQIALSSNNAEHFHGPNVLARYVDWLDKSVENAVLALSGIEYEREKRDELILKAITKRANKFGETWLLQLDFDRYGMGLELLFNDECVGNTVSTPVNDCHDQSDVPQ